MPSQAGDLPRDVDQLQAFVRELQAENAQLRSLLKGVTQQAFGTSSERGSVILGDQGCLALGDLAEMAAPVAANDDGAAASAGWLPASHVARSVIAAMSSVREPA